MNPSLTAPWYGRSGLAPLSDFESPQWQDTFRQLEGEQDAFLRLEPQFRSPTYKWPRNALHNWSRIWEYPYVYEHLRAQPPSKPDGQRPVVLDLGSGVTFFPFALAKLGWSVICADVDSVCQTDLERAAQVVSHGPGAVSFRLIAGSRLPLADGEADAICCISVLEHIPDFESTIREAVRVLKPGGRFVLTIDLDLRGDQEIGVAPHRRLKAILREYFEFQCPETTVHPADVLTSAGGPQGWRPPGPAHRAVFHLKQQIKPLLGRRARPLMPFLLAVEAMVLRRR